MKRISYASARSCNSLAVHNLAAVNKLVAFNAQTQAWLGKEVRPFLQRFTIEIFSSYVENQDVSKYFKFQDNRINSLEVTAFFILKK